MSQYVTLRAKQAKYVTKILNLNDQKTFLDDFQPAVMLCIIKVVSDWTTQILFDFLAKIDWVKFGSLESFGKLPEIENSEVKSLMLIVREIL